jgi:type I restriction enzyme S subunit
MDEESLTRVGSVVASVSDTHQRGKTHLIFLNTSDILLGKVLTQAYSPVANWPGQAKKSIQRNDILFSEIRPANGRWAFIDFDAEDYVVSTKLMVIRSRTDRVLPKFFYHFLTSVKTTSWLQHLAESRSGTFPQITFDQISELEIALPSLKVQAAITSLLDAINDKIELNGRMSAALEAMAFSLFKDWFVDFGPTHTKMKRLAPYLAPEVWGLFPDRLDDEGKPEGWTASNIGAEFLLTMGQSPPGDTYNECGEGLSFFQGRTDFGARYPTRRVYCTAPTRLANQDDTLVSVRAPVGDLNMAWEKCCIGRGVAAARHRSGSRSYSFYGLLSIQGALSAYEHTGTVFGAINKLQFEALKIIAPPQHLVSAYENTVAPLDERIRANEAENATLTATRDFLLPKLMSGEIHVRAAEKLVRQAAC